jgi:hypothetical protein
MKCTVQTSYAPHVSVLNSFQLACLIYKSRLFQNFRAIVEKWQPVHKIFARHLLMLSYPIRSGRRRTLSSLLVGMEAFDATPAHQDSLLEEVEELSQELHAFHLYLLKKYHIL